MIDKDDKYDKLLGDKLADFREEPPAGMFERIEQTLAAQVATAQAEEKVSEPVVVVPLWRRPVVRGFAAAVAAAVVALAVVVNMKDMAPTIVEVAQAVDVAQMPAVAAPEVGVKMPDAKALTEVEQYKIVTEVWEEPELDMLAKAFQPMQEEKKGVAQSGETKKTTTPRKRSTSRRNNSDVEEFWRTMLAQQERERGNEGPVEIGLYAANVGFNRGHVEVENVAGSSMLVSEKNQHSVGGQYMAPSLVAPREKSHLEHFMPVTVGVTVSRALNGWLSMDSGLLYTNLYSVSKSSGAISNYSMRRTMDYLGVPLALSASFANLGDLSFYGRLGGTVELCINANDKTFVDGVMANKSRLDVPTLTLSFDAALGASYQIVGAVGLFGEVGCSYWKSPADYPENYRTVHPLSLSSRFGLRFTFN